jgi:hypothetical protein
MSAVPDAPTNLKAIPGNAQVQLSWSAGPNGGSPITNYKVEYKLDTSSTWTVQYSMTTLIIYFLKNGSLYNFRVSAINANGTSQPSPTANATPFIPFTTTSCGITGFVPGPPPWSRAGGNNCPNCVSNYGYAECTADNGLAYSTYALDERRKAEILKYKGNSAQLSPAMFYSMLSRNAFTRKKSWATQTQTVTNPNVNNLPELKDGGIPVALQCNQPTVTCSLTSDSDVPGPVIQLCIDTTVPLYNYNLQVTPASGGKTRSLELFAFEPQPIPVPTPTPTPTPTGLIYEFTPIDASTTSNLDPPENSLGVIVFGEIYMTNGINTLVSANVSITDYDPTMSLFLYFFNQPGWLRESVVRIIEFQANSSYNPNSLDFANAIVSEGSPNYTVLTGANLNWSQPSGTYYVIWSQFNSKELTGGNPNLQMTISDTPTSPGPIPTYPYTPGTGHWYWAGSITATQ